MNKNILSRIWFNIQTVLFPYLEEELESLTAKQKQLICALELIRIEDFIQEPNIRYRGRPLKNRKAIARAFMAKAVYNFQTTRILIEQLHASIKLRRICGWEKAGELPSESVFSRSFAEFAQTELAQKVHEALIKAHTSKRLIGHISRDSTAIEAREQARKRTRNKMSKRKVGRPKKGEKAIKEKSRLQKQLECESITDMLSALPKSCDWGYKINSQGKGAYWKGYKLHVDFADGGIPISCVLTSASLYDNQVAIPLAERTRTKVTSLYDLMDAAYDAKEIKEHSYSLGHVPIIKPNKRRGKTIEMEPAQAKRYRERINAERGFSRLKEDFGAKHIRIKGHTKVMAHLMFGILALTVDSLIKFIV